MLDQVLKVGVLLLFNCWVKIMSIYIWNTTDDTGGMLYKKVISLGSTLKPLGKSNGDEVLLLHYSLTGIPPDFTKCTYHWTDRISNTTSDTGFSTGFEQQWTDLFVIKMPVSAPYLAQKTKRGREVTMDTWVDWFNENSIKLPLANAYMEHIKLKISKGVFV